MKLEPTDAAKPDAQPGHLDPPDKWTGEGATDVEATEAVPQMVPRKPRISQELAQLHRGWLSYPDDGGSTAPS